MYSLIIPGVDFFEVGQGSIWKIPSIPLWIKSWSTARLMGTGPGDVILVDGLSSFRWSDTWSTNNWNYLIVVNLYLT